MLSLKTVDVVIGIIFVFLLLSTLCAALREVLEAWFKTRAAYLERGIRELLHDRDGTGLVHSLFNHPLLFGLFMGNYVPSPLKDKLSVLANGRGMPSYIPSKSFAWALLDVAGRGLHTDEVSTDPASTPLTVQSIRDRLLNIENLSVRRVLLTALDASHGDLNLARTNLEDWFNSAMDRVSGWYKRSTQWIILAIALVVTVAMNLDTLELATYLYNHDQARAALVAEAEQVVESKQLPQGVESSKAALTNLPLPIGWHEAQLPQGSAWVNRVLGWLITALAATLGTPFWFDVLNKVMVIRSTVKPREKSLEEGSEDRQPRRLPVVEIQGAAAAAGAASAAVPVFSSNAVILPRDAESAVDCCGHGLAAEDETRDEDLPAAIGGVA